MASYINSGDLLTPAQLDKHMAVYAGPGSGKTHFLVNNVKNIVATHPKVSKSNERKVLCITYTNSAVEEIRRRLENYSSSVVVDTIHGFIIENIILPFQSDLKKVMKKDFDIDVARNAKITSQIEGLSILHGYEKEEVMEYLQTSTACVGIDYSKKILSEVEIDNKKFFDSEVHEFKHSSKIDKNHTKHIKKYLWEIVGKLTHDEILYFGYRMLQENSTITYALRVKFPFIFVDEFQDTNPLQTLILKYLGEKSTTIGVIGDVAQSIYSFQGAKPTQFSGFTIPGEKTLESYYISGNRRSTGNIVGLCNYLRSSDTLEQTSIKPYKTEEEKSISEQIPIRFLCGSAGTDTVGDLVQNGAVVLTRTWAGAFSYIRGINDEQRGLLNKIYNHYFPTSIDIRADIVEHNRVVWVRAFRFIMMLYSAYQTGSFTDVLKAISLYTNITTLKKEGIFTPQLILAIRKILSETFSGLSDDALVCEVLDKLNCQIASDTTTEIRETVFGASDFNVQYLSDFDEKIATHIKSLHWDTAQKLFDEVFSSNAKYMTVHQAKGLEWDTVIVGVTPTQRDKTSLINMISNPEILGENSADEFVRIYYVACSRARKALYIHIPDDQTLVNLIKEKLNDFILRKECMLTYEFL